jgi:hypothetical protein
MSELRPLGSEKLQGNEKLQRILELSRWNENTPNPVNEVSSSEYNITLSDGNQYEIVKEKVGYIIKKTISEGVSDYIEPMKNRKYFSSYSQALKKLNLMAKEYNTLFENEEGTSFFSEQKKFVLKTPRSEKKNDITEPSPVEPSPEPTLPPPPPPLSDDMSMDTPPNDDMGGEPMGDDTGMNMNMDDPMDDNTDVEDDGPEMEVSFKVIQKLVGKLGQKLRKYEENNEISDKDVKYIINSVLSAIDLTKLSEETREEIISKLEGMELDDELDQMDEPSSDEMDIESDIETEETPEEMGETWDKVMGNIASQRISRGIYDKGFPSEMREDSDIIDSFTESLFSESKVEKILESYFKPSKDENWTIQNEIVRLSESKQQRQIAKSFSKRNPQFNLIGRTNKKSLVFEHKNKKVKITLTGHIL